MRKANQLFITVLFLYLFMTRPVSADSRVAECSAFLKSETSVSNDSRVERLENYLNSHKSPLAVHSKTFINVADKYDLDWRLIPAISGVESTFGKNIPDNSYNAYGWANGKYRFSSWDNSIEIVGKTLKEKYIDRGAPTINKIAIRYAPPSSSWAWKVKYFMTKIEPWPVDFDLEG